MLRDCHFTGSNGVLYYFKLADRSADHISKFVDIVKTICSHKVYQQQSIIKNKADLVTIINEHEEMISAIEFIDFLMLDKSF